MDCHHLDPGGGMDPGGERWRPLHYVCIAFQVVLEIIQLYFTPAGGWAMCPKASNWHLLNATKWYKMDIWGRRFGAPCSISINSGLILVQTCSNFDPLNLLQSVPRVGASAKLSVFPLARLSGLKPSKLSEKAKKQQDWGRFIFVHRCLAVPVWQWVNQRIKLNSSCECVQPAVLHSHTHTLTDHCHANRVSQPQVICICFRPMGARYICEIKWEADKKQSM